MDKSKRHFLCNKLDKTKELMAAKWFRVGDYYEYIGEDSTGRFINLLTKEGFSQTVDKLDFEEITDIVWSKDGSFFTCTRLNWKDTDVHNVRMVWAGKNSTYTFGSEEEDIKANKDRIFAELKNPYASLERIDELLDELSKYE